MNFKTMGSVPVEMNFDVGVPSEEMRDTFEKWDEIHTIENLTEMSLDSIESERILFENDVARFKRIRYNRGKSVNAAMAMLAGKEPYTHAQLREARRVIEEEADRIRPRFKRTKGIKREQQKQNSREFLTKLIDKVEVTLFNSIF